MVTLYNGGQIKRAHSDQISGALAYAVEEYLLELTRREFLSSTLRDGPAWEVLLHAFITRHLGRDISVKEVQTAQRIPRASLSRCLNLLESEGWITRHKSLIDRRKSYISITEQATQLLERWFASRASMIASQRIRIQIPPTDIEEQIVRCA